MDTQAAIDRIRKLIKHAQGEGATEAELDSYMAKARKIMEEFNLDDKAIAESEVAKDTAYDSMKYERGFSRSGSLWQGDTDLAYVVGVVCGTRHFTGFRNTSDDGRVYYGRTGRVQTRHFIMWYGMPRDVAVSMALYAELKATVETMAAFRGYGSSGMNQAFRSYYLGFVNRLWQKANEQKNQSTVESGTTAIVLVKDGLLKRFAKDKLNLSRSKSRGTTIGDSTAYATGNADGRDVHLGTNGISGQKSRPQNLLE